MKAKSNSGICPRSSGLLQRACITSPALPSAARTACLLHSGSLCSTAAATLGNHTGVSKMLGSPTTRPHLHQWPFLASMPNLRYSPWPLHASKTSTIFVPLKLAKFNCQPKVQPWLPLEHSFCVLSGNTSKKIAPQWYWCLLNHC